MKRERLLALTPDFYPCPAGGFSRSQAQSCSSHPFYIILPSKILVGAVEDTSAHPPTPQQTSLEEGAVSGTFCDS